MLADTAAAAGSSHSCARTAAEAVAVPLRWAVAVAVEAMMADTAAAVASSHSCTQTAEEAVATPLGGAVTVAMAEQRHRNR
jgi:hypothetical protein